MACAGSGSTEATHFLRETRGSAPHSMNRITLPDLGLADLAGDYWTGGRIVETGAPLHVGKRYFDLGLHGAGSVAEMLALLLAAGRIPAADMPIWGRIEGIEAPASSGAPILTCEVVQLRLDPAGRTEGVKAYFRPQIDGDGGHRRLSARIAALRFCFNALRGRPAEVIAGFVAEIQRRDAVRPLKQLSIACPVQGDPDAIELETYHDAQIDATMTGAALVRDVLEMSRNAATAEAASFVLAAAERRGLVFGHLSRDLFPQAGAATSVSLFAPSNDEGHGVDPEALHAALVGLAGDLRGKPRMPAIAAHAFRRCFAGMGPAREHASTLDSLTVKIPDDRRAAIDLSLQTTRSALAGRI